MRQRHLYRAVAVASALVFAVSACSSSDDGGSDDDKVKVLGADGDTGQAFADKFEGDDGALVGLRGTTPLTDLSDDFKDRLLKVNPDLRDFNYAGESYDGVIISSLAAQIARSSQGVDIAKYINGVTTKGEKCKDFKACKDLIDDGKDIDYDSITGPLEFTDPGEPSVASFGIMSYTEDNKVTDVEYVLAGDEANATKQEVAPPPRDQAVTGGPLKFGAMLPQTGGLAFLGPPMFAGVKLAVQEVNDAGGVNGSPITSEERDDGTSADVANQSADALLQSGVDVIIGAAGSGVSKAVLDKVTGAGVILFSPSNTSDEFTTYNDRGLYFRTAPPDVLQAKPLANLILEDGADRVVVMYQNTPYGAGLAENIKKNLVAGDVPEGDVLLIAYDEKGRDFSAEVQKAKDHNPEYVAVIGYDEAESIIKKLNETGIGPKR